MSDQAVLLAKWSPMREAFWQNNSLLNHILFEWCLLWYLAQSTFFWTHFMQGLAIEYWRDTVYERGPLLTIFQGSLPPWAFCWYLLIDKASYIIRKLHENPSERISTHYDLLVSTTGTLTLWHSATIFYSKHSMSSNFCVGYALLAH